MSLMQEEEQTLLPVVQNQTSALEDAAFANVKEKAQTWLTIQPPSPGREMDNVFFNEERFELMVDTRGYKPEDLKCTISPTGVEVTAERQEITPGSQRCMSTTRSYQLPKQVLPQQAICCLSSEGILIVAAPWQK